MSREAAAQSSNSGAAPGGGNEAAEGNDALGGFDDSGLDDGLLSAFEDALGADDEARAQFDRPKARGKAARGKEDEAQDDAGDDDGDDGDDDRDPDDDDGDDDENDDEADEAKAGKKAKDDDGDEGADPDADHVELEDGTKIAVRDLLEAHTFKQGVNATLEQVKQHFTQEGEKHLTEFKTQAEAKLKDLQEGLAIIDELIPKIEKPPVSMLDKNSDDYDPEGYHFLLRAHEELTTKVAAARAKVDAGKKTAGNLDAKASEAKVAENMTKLLAKATDLKDPKKAKAFADDMRATLKEAEFSDDEINGLIDYRMILIVRDAMAHRAAMKKGKPKIEGERKSPRLVRGRRANAPGKGKGNKSNGKPSADAIARLQRTGRVADADLESVWGFALD